MILLDLNENIWVANLVSSGTILTVLGFLILRFIAGYDKRIKDLDCKSEAVKKKSEEIEKNYLHRFEEVRDKIDNAARNISEHFTEEIKQVVKDKYDYRIQQSGLTSEIKAKLDGLIQAVNSIKNKI